MLINTTTFTTTIICSYSIQYFRHLLIKRESRKYKRRKMCDIPHIILFTHIDNQTGSLCLKDVYAIRQTKVSRNTEALYLPFSYYEASRSKQNKTSAVPSPVTARYRDC